MVMATDPREAAAEALAAVTGIQVLLDETPKPVGMTQGREAMALPKRLEEELRAFLLQTKHETQKVEFPAIDYMETLAKLSRPIEQSQREALMSEFEDPALALAYVGVLERGVAWLLQQLPRRMRPSFTGDVPVEPAHTEMSLFGRQWQVAADPLQVVRDMREGILVTDQVDALQALFPEVAALIADTTLRLLAKLAAEQGTPEKPWEPDWCVQKGLFTLLQMSPVDPQFAAQLQQGAKKAEANQAAQEGISIALKGAGDSETPTQRLQQS